MNTPVRPGDVGTLFDATPDNPRAVIGDNRPPPFDSVALAERIAEANSFVEAGGQWLDLKELETEEQAKNLVDFTSGTRLQIKKIEEWRVNAKAPHIAAGKAVDRAVADMLEMLDKTLKRAMAMDTTWKIKRRALAEAEARAITDAAAEKAAEAERLRLQAIERNDISGEVEAEVAAAEAQQTIRAAENLAAEAMRTRSASGAGRTTSLVTIRSGQIDNIRLAFMWVQDDPRVVEAVQMAVNAKIRAAGFDGNLPSGITLVEKEQAR